MMASDLLKMSYPAEFTAGARSAVTTCLRIEPTEKVTLITDQATEQIAASIGEQLAERGCEWNAFRLEDLAARPLANMPAAVLADMESSQVSIFAVQVQQNELQSPHADDRCRESAADAACAHGEYHGGGDVPGDAGGF